MKKGLKLSLMGVIAFVFGLITTTVVWISTCEGPAGPIFTGCGDSKLGLTFGLITIIGLGMIFLGSYVDKRKSDNK